MVAIKRRIDEYSEWLREDIFSAIRYVKPTLEKLIQGVKFTNADIPGSWYTQKQQPWEYVLFETDKMQSVPDFEFFDCKRLKGDPFYLSISRPDTFTRRPVPVGWPIYDNDCKLPFKENLALSLIELGIHEAFEWIAFHETKAKYKYGSEEFWDTIDCNELWPHFQRAFDGQVKLNNKWFPIQFSGF